MKKELIGAIAFIIIMALMIAYGLDRIEKINNGEMIVVSESQMDRQEVKELQKLKPLYYRLADGKKKVNCYRVNVKKADVNKAGFDEDTNIEIEVREDEIVLKKGEKDER